MGNVTKACGHVSPEELRARIKRAPDAGTARKLLVIMNAMVDPRPWALSKFDPLVLFKIDPLVARSFVKYSRNLRNFFPVWLWSSDFREA